MVQARIKVAIRRKQKEIEELNSRLKRLAKVDASTVKLHYLDPRITVAWCARNDVSIEDVFSEAMLSKFAWAMDTGPDFRFTVCSD